MTDSELLQEANSLLNKIKACQKWNNANFVYDESNIITEILYSLQKVLNETTENTIPELPEELRLERLSSKFGTAVCTLYSSKTREDYTADGRTLREAVINAIGKSNHE